MSNKHWIGLAFLLTACSATTSSTAQLRPMVYAETTVEASVSEVWTDWTTAEGVTSFFAAEANIVLERGGPYQLYFAPDAPEGSKGSDFGRILGWQEERMLHVTWDMPPYMPEIRPHQTVLQLEFIEVDDDTTTIKLFHTGFGDSDTWEEGRAYFAKTWPEVLTLYKAEAEK